MIYNNIEPILKDKEYLERINKPRKEDLYASMINFGMSIDTAYDPNISFMISDIRDISIKIISILSEMDGKMRSRNVKFYDKDIDLELDDKDILFITTSMKEKYLDRLINIRCRSGNIIYFGVKSDKLCMFGKSNKTNQLIAIDIYDGDRSGYSADAYNNFMLEVPDGKLRIHIVTPTMTSTDIDMELLTEGLQISKDGTVKFIFNKKTRYMDLYDQSHKELVVNWGNRNADGMKHNLAFMFSIIIDVERNYIHNKTSSAKDEVKQDAIKARMFAMNDFKTYMNKLKMIDSNFDFTKYYESKGYDKISFTVTPDDILGIRKLFQLIMMG